MSGEELEPAIGVDPYRPLGELCWDDGLNRWLETTKPKEPTMSKFEVFKDAEGGFTVRLRAKNGRKRNVSESYTRHRDAIRAARGIRDDSRGAVIVDLVNGGVTVE
jgi:uncharacterized protein YegP (UPF0339 family)